LLPIPVLDRIAGRKRFLATGRLSRESENRSIMKLRPAMFLEVDEAEFRADPDAMLERVQSGCEAVVIKADGRIIAALVNPRLFEQVRGMHERCDPVRAKIAEDFRGVPEEVGTREIEAAFARERGH